MGVAFATPTPAVAKLTIAGEVSILTFSHPHDESAKILLASYYLEDNEKIIALID